MQTRSERKRQGQDSSKERRDSKKEGFGQQHMSRDSSKEPSKRKPNEGMAIKMMNLNPINVQTNVEPIELVELRKGTRLSDERTGIVSERGFL